MSCSVPLYLAQNESIVRKCGAEVSKTITIILILLVLVATGFIIYFFYDELINSKLKLLLAILVPILLIGLVWYMRDINGDGRYREWKAVQDKINAYIDNGFTRKEAISTIQKDINSKAQTRAINNIASSMYFGRPHYHFSF